MQCDSVLYAHGNQCTISTCFALPVPIDALSDALSELIPRDVPGQQHCTDVWEGSGG